MFHPLPLYIGLRYIRRRSQGFFVSFISWVSMLGICVGVMALITVISVMNGLEGELPGRLLSLASHATLSGEPEQLQGPARGSRIGSARKRASSASLPTSICRACWGEARTCGPR